MGRMAACLESQSGPSLQGGMCSICWFFRSLEDGRCHGVHVRLTTGYNKNPMKHQGMVIIHVISCNYRMIRITTYHLNSDKFFRIRIR